MKSKVPEFPKPINPVYKRLIRCASVSPSKKWIIRELFKTYFHEINSSRVSKINNFSILALRVMWLYVQLQNNLPN